MVNGAMRCVLCVGVAHHFAVLAMFALPFSQSFPSPLIAKSCAEAEQLLKALWRWHKFAQKNTLSMRMQMPMQLQLPRARQQLNI